MFSSRLSYFSCHFLVECFWSLSGIMLMVVGNCDSSGGLSLAICSLYCIKFLSFLRSLLSCQMLRFDFVGGRLNPRPRLSVFVMDSSKVVLERFSNFVWFFVNLRSFFVCQLVPIGSLAFDSRCCLGVLVIMLLLANVFLISSVSQSNIIISSSSSWSSISS